MRNFNMIAMAFVLFGLSNAYAVDDRTDTERKYDELGYFDSRHFKTLVKRYREQTRFFNNLIPQMNKDIGRFSPHQVAEVILIPGDLETRFKIVENYLLQVGRGGLDYMGLGYGYRFSRSSATVISKALEEMSHYLHLNDDQKNRLQKMRQDVADYIRHKDEEEVLRLTNLNNPNCYELDPYQEYLRLNRLEDVAAPGGYPGRIIRSIDNKKRWYPRY